jgi:hypothetical protein
VKNNKLTEHEKKLLKAFLAGYTLSPKERLSSHFLGLFFYDFLNGYGDKEYQGFADAIAEQMPLAIEVRNELEMAKANNASKH